MTLNFTHRLLHSTKPFQFLKTNHPTQHSNTNALPFPNPPLLPFTFRPPTRSNSLYGRVSSLLPRSHSSSSSPFSTQIVLEIFILFAFSLVLLCLRLFSSVLLPDFPRRWHGLVAFASEAEARTNAYPSHLWQAIVAYEDRRFFSHFGIDPVGIARAVVSFSALGGGSTITQQLVKNTFLKNERTLSRKMVEMVMSLALEKTMLKGQILSCYIIGDFFSRRRLKIYWGHGIYGVESASTFYFGKHPSCLSLGESAMLAGLIPAPELRSPLRDPSRGKTFQARVLKRMVDVGFLDFETALFVVKQYLPLHVTESEAPVVFLLGVGTNSKLRDIWDWETESKIWEACEDMERWALKVRDGASAKRSCSQY